MITVVATVIGVLVAGSLVWVVERLARHSARRFLGILVGGICLVLFVLLNVSDWPGGFLNEFWLEHAVVAASAGTMLLGSTVFLVYRHRDQEKQKVLDESIVDVGESGVVAHLVDIDVALSLLAAPDAAGLKVWPDWDAPGKPLRWLRHERLEILSTHDHRAQGRDPRAAAPAPHINCSEWRLELVHQMVRRVAGGIRDWAPVLIRSRKGQADLVAYGNVRVELLHIEHALRNSSPMSTEWIIALQQEVRSLAWRLELDGQAPSQRVELVRPEPPRGIRRHHRLSRLLQLPNGFATRRRSAPKALPQRAKPASSALPKTTADTSNGRVSRRKVSNREQNATSHAGSTSATHAAGDRD